MNDKNIKKPNIQKDILKFLAEKQAVSITELKGKINLKAPSILKERVWGGNSFNHPLALKSAPPQQGEENKNSYAINRSIKNLVESGCVEIKNSDNKKYLKITKKGQGKLNCIKLEGEDALVSNAWDGFWRIIILDLPENRKNEREALRYLLKKANFVCLKNTVWISPYPYEHLFSSIKKDFGLNTELMIIVTNKLDEETHFAFLNAIKK